MAKKIIKAFIDGVIQEIEVEDVTSPEQAPSYEDRLNELEDKPIITDGNFLVGNGTEELEEMTPEETLSHINGASIRTMTSDEFNALSDDEVNANTMYVLTDTDDDGLITTDKIADGAVTPEKLDRDYATKDYVGDILGSIEASEGSIGQIGASLGAEIFNSYEGEYANIASGNYSHAEGQETTASGWYSHAEGAQTTASGDGSHSEGGTTSASGEVSHAEGSATRAIGQSSHAEGCNTTASGTDSHSEGYSTNAIGQSSHAEGYNTTASGDYSHAEGYETSASGENSHAEGSSTNQATFITTSADNAEIQTAWSTKKFSLAKGENSHIEGKDCLALGSQSHAEGSDTTAIGEASHAEGRSTTASGDYSHAEGYETTASGYYSHAEGQKTTSSGTFSHAEGYETSASGYESHAEGFRTTASGNTSHAEGQNTTASSSYQHVQGKYNIEDAEGKYAHIVGNGDKETRSNAHTVDWDGNGWFAGDVYVHSLDEDGNYTDKLATESYIDEKISEIDITGGTGEIPDNSITTSKLVDGSVTPEKLDREYLTEHQSLEGYATEEWVENKGYLTEHQSLEEYAKTNYVDERVSALVNSAPETLDTLGEVATAIQNNADVVEALNDAIGNKANKADLSTVATSGSYNDLTDKPEIPTVEGLATEDYVDNKFDNITIDSDQIVDGAVTTPKIADKSITGDKLAENLDFTPSLIKEEIEILDDFKNYDVFSVVKTAEKIPTDWVNVKIWSADDNISATSTTPNEFDFSQVVETNYAEIGNLPTTIDVESLEGQDIMSALCFYDDKSKKYFYIQYMQNVNTSPEDAIIQVECLNKETNETTSLKYYRDLGWDNPNKLDVLSGDYTSLKIVDFASLHRDNTDVIPEGSDCSPEILLNLFLKDMMTIYSLPGFYISYRAPGTAQLDHVPSDYDIHDEEVAGHIKNRPFYDSRMFDDIVGTEILATATNEFLVGISVSIVKVADLPDTPNAIADKIEYIQGVSNTFTDYRNMGNASYAFGEGAWLIDESDIGVVFAIQRETTFPEAGFYVLKPNSVELGDVRIKFKGELKQIDNKFIKTDSVPTKDSSNLIDSNAVFNAVDEIKNSRGIAIGNQGTGFNAEVFNSYDLNTNNEADKPNEASGSYSHAEGRSTKASGLYGSHAEGNYTTASGNASHAEGNNTIAGGEFSHAEGSSTKASGSYSHAEGQNTTASSSYQHVQGKYNIEDAEGKYAHIVGNGDGATRSNAHTLEWNGTAWYAGDVYVHALDENGEYTDKLATESYVDDKINEVISSDDLTQSDYAENDTESMTYIKNKPFYEETFYDNNVLAVPAYSDELVSSNVGTAPSSPSKKCKFVKIADLSNDAQTTLKQIIKVVKKDGSEQTSFSVDPTGFYDYSTGEEVFVPTSGYSLNGTNLIACDTSFDYNNVITIPESGLYEYVVWKASEATSSIEMNDTEIHFESIIHKMDSKFLPEQYDELVAKMSTVDKNSSKITSLEGKVNTVESNINSLKSADTKIKEDIDTIKEDMAGLQSRPNGISVVELPTIAEDGLVVALTKDDDVSFRNLDIEVKTREELSSVDENGVTTVGLSNIVLLNGVKIGMLPTDDEDNYNMLWEAYDEWATVDYVDIGIPKIGLGIYDKTWSNGLKILYDFTNAETGIPYITLTKVVNNADSLICSFIYPEGDYYAFGVTESGWYKLVDGAYTKLTTEELSIFSQEFESAYIVDYWAMADADSYNATISDGYGVKAPLAISSFVDKFVTITAEEGLYKASELTTPYGEVYAKWTKWNDDYATKEYVDEKIEEISSLGGQVQSDYAETDSTKVTYIKNKPLVDSQVTDGSTKLITSGAVFTAIGEAVDGIEHPEGAYIGKQGVKADGTVATGAEVFNDYTNNTASGEYSHAEGCYTTAGGVYSHAEGQSTTTSGSASHAEGGGTTASGAYSHAEGDNTTAKGNYSHAEGGGTTASGAYSHAEGNSTNKAASITTSTDNTEIQIAWGASKFSLAKGIGSHIEGKDNLALGQYSHAEGYYTTASGNGSHAEGQRTTASGMYSHVEGSYSTASGQASHAEGNYTTASGDYQHVQGKHNVIDTEHKYAHIVGNGTSAANRSNAHTLDWDGNAWFAGEITLGADNVKVATETYVNDALSNVGSGEYATKEELNQLLDSFAAMLDAANREVL